jgi:hypothetical protein
VTTQKSGPMDLPVIPGRIHQPKGGMCATCVWHLRNCAGLNFEGMPVIDRDDETGAKIVRCTRHLRTEKPLPAGYIAA